MANSVRVRRREYVKPGFDANGSPVPNKEQVSGRIVVTAFNGGGEALTPSDLGLETLDYIYLAVEEGVGSKSGKPRTAVHSASAGEFYVFQNGSTTLTSGKDFSVMFTAEGASLRAPQFL